jgi:hypothetical protein
MSALWRGMPHGYKRDASSMVPKREAFQRNAAAYDTIVLTESLPVRVALKSEHSAFYLRHFYCALKSANRDARVYLFETWANLQGNAASAGAAEANKLNWRAEMAAERRAWEELADGASRASVQAPGGWRDKIGMSSSTNGGCDIEDPIFIVPAGRALVALSDRLAASDERSGFMLPDRSPLTIGHLFTNAYVDWPSPWPVTDDPADTAHILSRLRLRNPSRPHDDIHMSALGIYYISLVHFATLYRQTPVGLPAPQSIGEPLARSLQCLAWKTVVDDPRSGVLGTAGC